MPGRMEGAVAVVIGGASGIGWATAQLLAAEGVSVVIGDIDIEGGRKRAVELGGRAEAVRVDVVDEESVKGIFEGAEAQHGRLDIAVNCAGVNLPGYITDLEAQTWRRTVDICLTGGFFVIKHAARAMTAGGSIVSITSLNARQAAAGFAGYCSAKAGLAMLTEVAALELGDRGYASTRFRQVLSKRHLSRVSPVCRLFRRTSPRTLRSDVMGCHATLPKRCSSSLPMLLRGSRARFSMSTGVPTYVGTRT